MTQDEIRDSFRNEMKNLFAKTVKETKGKYKPNRFKIMMAQEKDPIDVARKIAVSKGDLYGFTKLFELGRLDLTVEALIDRFAGTGIFDGIIAPYDIAVCRKRLGH